MQSLTVKVNFNFSLHVSPAGAVCTKDNRCEGNHVRTIVYHHVRSASLSSGRPLPASLVKDLQVQAKVVRLNFLNKLGRALARAY